MNDLNAWLIAVIVLGALLTFSSIGYWSRGVDKEVLTNSRDAAEEKYEALKVSARSDLDEARREVEMVVAANRVLKGKLDAAETEIKRRSEEREMELVSLLQKSADGAPVFVPDTKCGATHHHACACRERAFIEMLALAQETMGTHASSAVWDEWKRRMKDLIGADDPRVLLPA